ncbi:hypothetical protein SAMN02799630_02596 [Paenibacillus sp. UNCCL117]|uniref:hypothetical protein n=1 Tax=unclassified Paenibacillus TaxID=185978 RepID=UPI000881A1AF|nr:MULTISPECIES: hypothetical protein [unclassified Paenibacillus]SDC07232.1 hypothetical protein SAMN04488602_101265 [Paenibacillus sp. cl123]SFW38002.1 hypothetical protein SAMN02799630_02596 [Paenibacillus sp. UNCCL117]
MIEVVDDQRGSRTFASAGELAAVSGEPFAAGSRVKGAEGNAVDWQHWYAAWSGGDDAAAASRPTHLQVFAADEFQATIPWQELQDAFFVYEQDNGLPLQKSQPIRLYVPNGSSECLNVKSVIRLRIARDPLLGEAATYGFLNRISSEQLLSARRG